MSRTKKREKQLLKYYSEYTDEELIELYKTKAKEYNKLIESEELASRILKENGNMVYYAASFNKKQKREYLLLQKAMVLRGLGKYLTICDAPITTDDIVRRIEENLYEEINFMDEYCYLPTTFYEEDKWYLENPILATDFLSLNKDAMARIFDENNRDRVEHYTELINKIKNSYILVGSINMSQHYTLPVYLNNNRYYLADSIDENNLDFYPLNPDFISSIDFINPERGEIQLDNIKAIYEPGDTPSYAKNQDGKIVLTKK